MLGGTFNLTVQFEPNDTNFRSLLCGYEIGSTGQVIFVKYYPSPLNTLQLVRPELRPPSYVGRLAIANKTTLVISNVKFQDEGTRYYCKLQYFDTAIKTLISTKQAIASVYGK